MVELTAIQNKALCLLVAGRTEDQIVAETGVSKSTIGRWKREPKFKEKLQDAVAKTYDAAIAELVSGSQEAARELKRIIHDPDIPSKNKISAINVLLSHGAKAKNVYLERRLEKLENNLDEEGNLQDGIDVEEDTTA